MTVQARSERSAKNHRPAYGEGREALLQAAVTVVAEEGLRHLTYRRVAEAAGVTHGLVKHHFGSRDALIEEAVRYSMARSVEITALDADVSSIDDFAALLSATVTADPEIQAFQYEVILESRRRPDLRPYVAELYATYRESTSAALARLGITDLTSHELVFAALDGLVFQQLASGDADLTERALSRLRELLARA